MMAVNKKKIKQKMNNYIRIAIQVIFFICFPSAFATAFAGVKYIFTQIGMGENIEITSFVAALIAVILFTFVFGRFFCGYACAFGTMGDFFHFIYLWICKKIKKKPIAIKESVLKPFTYVKYVILALIAILCVTNVYGKTAGYSPWDVFSMMIAVNTDFVKYVPGICILLMIIVGMMVCERFFCRFLCPMGAVFAMVPSLPFFSLNRKKESCIKGCSACERKCPMQVKLPDKQMDIPSGECIMCQKCIGICPKNNAGIDCINKKSHLTVFTIIRFILLLLLLYYAGV